MLAIKEMKQSLLASSESNAAVWLPLSLFIAFQKHHDVDL